MSDDLFAELEALKSPSAVSTPSAPKTIPAVDLSNPKYGGETPNVQSYWKVFADHIQPAENSGPYFLKNGDEYTLCVLPWTHGKYITNVPIDVIRDASGKYVTVTQGKNLSKGEVVQVRTRLTSHFQKCEANGTLPVDLLHFMTVNNFVDEKRGMLAYRADLISVIKELIPSPPTAAPAAEPAQQTPVVPLVLHVQSPRQVQSPPYQQPPPAVQPAQAPPQAQPEVESELYDFIIGLQKARNVDPRVILNVVGCVEFERQERTYGLDAEDLSLVNALQRNKRYLSREGVNQCLPAKIAKRCTWD